MASKNKTLRMQIPVKIMVDSDNDGRDAVYIEARSFNKKNEPKTWAITMNSGCMSKKTGNFDYEPSPSNRDDDYIKEYRFTKFGYAESVYLKFYGDKSPFQTLSELRGKVKFK